MNWITFLSYLGICYALYYLVVFALDSRASPGGGGKPETTVLTFSEDYPTEKVLLEDLARPILLLRLLGWVASVCRIFLHWRRPRLCSTPVQLAFNDAAHDFFAFMFLSVLDGWLRAAGHSRNAAGNRAA